MAGRENEQRRRCRRPVAAADERSTKRNVGLSTRIISNFVSDERKTGSVLAKTAPERRQLPPLDVVHSLMIIRPLKSPLPTFPPSQSHLSNVAPRTGNGTEGGRRHWSHASDPPMSDRRRGWTTLRSV